MNDLIGAKTLKIMSQAKNYNRWLFGLIRPWISSPAAEVGAGTGTFSRMMSNSGLAVTAIDKNSQYLSSIKRDDPRISTIVANMENLLSSRLHNKFASVIVLNVIEHIQNDAQALANIYAMLRPSGLVVILVPAHPGAYGTLDKNLGHIRRYEIGLLIWLLESAGFKIIHHRCLNLLGLAGWWINGSVFKRSIIPASQVQIFDIISRPFIFLEKYIRFPVGLSFLIVAQKP